MRTYEEYDSPAEKRDAQRGATRGKATGMARGYILVFDEDGSHRSGTVTCLQALGELMSNVEPGDPPRSVTYATPSHGFLRSHCRKVGFFNIPPEWQLAIVRKLKDSIIQDWNADYNAVYRRLISRVEKACA